LLLERKYGGGSERNTQRNTPVFCVLFF